ncbi:MAG: lactate utilization protein [Thermoplasmata archaeon]|nr:lactate utilization protein [Thermoplasmata archaeon]
MSATASTAQPLPAVPAERSAPLDFARLASHEQIRATVAALEQNGIHAIVAEDRADAVRTVLSLIPPDSEVLDATSQTLVALGLTEALADPARFQNLRPALGRLAQEKKPREQRKLGAAPDVIVGSVHAVTEQGQVVVASATGSQLGPYAYNAGRVIWVVGTQKIVPDLATAFQRVEEHSFPLENARAQKVYGMGSFLGKHLVVSREFQAGRITLVFVPENLGF